MSVSPIDKAERLAALQRSGLLDSPPEAVFDALVELARDLLGGTAALVSLVDDRRQFFKAQVGLGEPWASARETPLTHSFCQHVVNTHAPLLVENARTDERVKDNRAIDELSVVAYAGVPLVDEGDFTLGALCVVDGQPREWTEKDVRTLRTLAKAVMAEVALRQSLVHRQQEAAEREQLLRSLQDTEAALRESLAHTRQVMEAAGAGIWVLDVATGIVNADARTMALMGMPRDDTLTKDSGLGQMNPQDAVRVAAAVEAVMRGENEGRYHLEFRTGGRDGAPEHWVESRAQARFDAGGKATHLAGVNVDITARKVAEAEREELTRRVHASEALLRLAHADAEAARGRLTKFFENAPAALGTVRGPHHVFEMVNPRYRELMGTHRELLGRPMAEAAPEVVAQGFIQLFDTVYRTGEPFFAEGIPAKLDRRGDGQLEDVFFNLTFQPVRDLQGQVEGVDIFGFDVTSQVRLRQREEELKRLAEERTALEQQFIGIVSHDLRNPLAAILMGTSVLAHNPALSERGVKTVLRISSAAERASRMVRDLLDFTQARLGKGIPVYPRPLNLAEALEGWVEESRAAAPERDVTVYLQCDGHARVDPDRMAQVVGNLVSNALKYSPPDSPVAVRLREEPGALVLEVHNHGPPIPEAQRARLFQPLERGHGERDMSTRSVGLGLFIVKHVVEAHGGSISVTSTPEAGTNFAVRLPS